MNEYSWKELASLFEDLTVKMSGAMYQKMCTWLGTMIRIQEIGL